MPTTVSSPSSLHLSSYVAPFRPAIILTAFCLTFSSSSCSLTFHGDHVGEATLGAALLYCLQSFFCPCNRSSSSTGLAELLLSLPLCALCSGFQVSCYKHPHILLLLSSGHLLFFHKYSYWGLCLPTCMTLHFSMLNTIPHSSAHLTSRSSALCIFLSF